MASFARPAARSTFIVSHFALRKGLGFIGFRFIFISKTVESLDRAVVGSIMVRTSVTLVAGKPLISACRRRMASSLAR